MRYYGTQNEVKAYLNRLQSETTIQVTPSIVKTLNDRVESLKKSGVWSQYSLGFNDVDADSYFQRASVNDVIGRSEVCWFVRGIKSLGLWQNMVSWPLRSYQNAGTGSTVFSLGGLGIFNGTMVNSPTWGVNGVFFNGNDSDQYISLPNNTISTGTSDFSMGGVAAAARKLSGDTRTHIISHGDGNSSTQAGAVATENFTINQAYVSETWNGYVFYTSNSVRNFNLILSIVQNQILYGFYNSISMGTDTTLTPGYNRSGQLIAIGTGRTAGALYAKMLGTISFAFVFNKSTINEQEQFYRLYRAVLGSNLGLP
jgi:hypothetical protein